MVGKEAIMSKNSNGMSTGMAIVCTLGIFLIIGLIIELGTPKCSKSGCDNDAKDGSNYCYLHDNSYYKYKSYSSSTSTKSSSTSSSGTSSESTSSSKTTNYRGSSSSKDNHSSMDSYDDGYNDVYEDDDYDWDRYDTDDDYAAGVDDAMEDEGW